MLPLVVPLEVQIFGQDFGAPQLGTGEAHGLGLVSPFGVVRVVDVVPGRDLPPPHCSQELVSFLKLAVSGGPDHCWAGARGVPPTTLSLEGNL